MHYTHRFRAEFNEEGGVLGNNAHGESMQMLNVTLRVSGVIFNGSSVLHPFKWQ